jgi:hypothetical protein
MIRIVDALGRTARVASDRVEESGSKIARFDAGNLPSGTYFVELLSGATVLRQPIQLSR